MYRKRTKTTQENTGNSKKRRLKYELYDSRFHKSYNNIKTGDYDNYSIVMDGGANGNVNANVSPEYIFFDENHEVSKLIDEFIDQKNKISEDINVYELIKNFKDSIGKNTSTENEKFLATLFKKYIETLTDGEADNTITPSIDDDYVKNIIAQINTEEGNTIAIFEYDLYLYNLDAILKENVKITPNNFTTFYDQIQNNIKKAQKQFGLNDTIIKSVSGDGVDSVETDNKLITMYLPKFLNKEKTEIETSIAGGAGEAGELTEQTEPYKKSKLKELKNENSKKTNNNNKTLRTDFTNGWDNVLNHIENYYGFKDNKPEIDGTSHSLYNSNDRETIERYFKKCNDLQYFYLDKQIELYNLFKKMNTYIELNQSINKTIKKVLDPKYFKKINGDKSVKLLNLFNDTQINMGLFEKTNELPEKVSSLSMSGGALFETISVDKNTLVGLGKKIKYFKVNNTYDFTFTNKEKSDDKIQIIMTYGLDNGNNMIFNNIKSNQNDINFDDLLKNKNYKLKVIEVNYVIKSIEDYKVLQLIKEIQLSNEKSIEVILGKVGTKKETIDDLIKEYERKKGVKTNNTNEKWKTFNTNNLNSYHFENNNRINPKTSSDKDEIQRVIYKCYDLQLLYLVKHLEVIEIFKMVYYYYDMLIKKIGILFYILSLYQKENIDIDNKTITLPLPITELKADELRPLLSGGFNTINGGATLTIGDIRGVLDKIGEYIQKQIKSVGEYTQQTIGVNKDNIFNNLNKVIPNEENSGDLNDDKINEIFNILLKYFKNFKEKTKNLQNLYKYDYVDKLLIQLLKLILPQVAKKVEEKQSKESTEFSILKEISYDILEEEHKIQHKQSNTRKIKTTKTDYDFDFSKIGDFSKMDYDLSKKISENFDKLFEHRIKNEIDIKEEKEKLYSKQRDSIETIKTLFIDYNAEKDEGKQNEIKNQIKENYIKLFTISEREGNDADKGKFDYLIEAINRNINSNNDIDIKYQLIFLKLLEDIYFNKNEKDRVDLNTIDEEKQLELLDKLLKKVKSKNDLPENTVIKINSEITYITDSAYQALEYGIKTIKAKQEEAERLAKEEAEREAREKAEKAETELNDKKKIVIDVNTLIKEKQSILNTLTNILNLSSNKETQVLGALNKKSDGEKTELLSNIENILALKKKFEDLNKEENKEKLNNKTIDNLKTQKKEFETFLENISKIINDEKLTEINTIIENRTRSDIEAIQSYSLIKQLASCWNTIKPSGDDVYNSSKLDSDVIERIYNVSNKIWNEENFNKIEKKTTAAEQRKDTYTKKLIECFINSYEQYLEVNKLSEDSSITTEQFDEFQTKFDNLFNELLVNDEKDKLNKNIRTIFEDILGAARVIVRVKPLIDHNTAPTITTKTDGSKTIDGISINDYKVDNYYDEKMKNTSIPSMTGGYTYQDIIDIRESDGKITLGNACKEKNTNYTKTYGPFSSIYTPNYNNFDIYYYLFGLNKIQNTKPLLNNVNDKTKQPKPTLKLGDIKQNTKISENKGKLTYSNNNSEDLITKLNKGGNVVLFGYGFSGSGKTYTLLEGSQGERYDPSLLEQFMKDNSEFISKVEFLDIYPLGISKDDNSNTENKVKIFCEENIDEKAKELYGEGHYEQNKNYNSIKIKEELNFQTIKTRIQTLETYRRNHLRICATPNNDDSSRSFLQITLHLTNGAKMIFFDMPGTENTVRIRTEFFGKTTFEDVKEIRINETKTSETKSKTLPDQEKFNNAYTTTYDEKDKPTSITLQNNTNIESYKQIKPENLALLPHIAYFKNSLITKIYFDKTIPIIDISYENIANLSMEITLFLNGLSVKSIFDLDETHNNKTIKLLTPEIIKKICQHFINTVILRKKDKKTTTETENENEYRYFTLEKIEQTNKPDDKIIYKDDENDKNNIERVFEIFFDDKPNKPKWKLNITDKNNFNDKNELYDFRVLVDDTTYIKNSNKIKQNLDSNKSFYRHKKSTKNGKEVDHPLIRYFIFIMNNILQNKGSDDNIYGCLLFFIYKYVNFIVKQGSAIVTTLEHLKFFFLSNTNQIEKYNKNQTDEKKKYSCESEKECKNLLDNSKSYIKKTTIIESSGEREGIILEETIDIGKMNEFKLLSILQHLAQQNHILNNLQIKSYKNGENDEYTLDLFKTQEGKSKDVVTTPREGEGEGEGEGQKQNKEKGLFIMFTNIKIFRDDSTLSTGTDSFNISNSLNTNSKKNLNNNLNLLCDAEYDTLEFAQSISSTTQGIDTKSGGYFYYPSRLTKKFKLKNIKHLKTINRIKRFTTLKKLNKNKKNLFTSKTKKLL